MSNGIVVTVTPSPQVAVQAQAANTAVTTQATGPVVFVVPNPLDGGSF